MLEWSKKDTRFDPENSNRPPPKRREKRDRDDESSDSDIWDHDSDSDGTGSGSREDGCGEDDIYEKIADLPPRGWW